MATARKVEPLEEKLEQATAAPSQAAPNPQDEVHITRLSERDSRRLLEILDSDEEPTPALRRAKAKYERLIATPDI